MEQTSENLVIVRAGGRSCHPRWLSGGRREFDLLVSAYAPDAPPAAGPGMATVLVPGAKIAGYAATFAAHRALIERYARVALIDDDIEADAVTLSAAFALGRAHGLVVWQPSLTWDSHFSYAGVLSQRRSFLLRYVNFVEMMCPFFRTDRLLAIAPLFACGFETGIDQVWHRSADPAWFRMAVLDAVSVRHPRPVGREKTANGFGARESYDVQIGIVQDRFDARFRGMIAYAGLDPRGERAIAGRANMAGRATRLFAAIRDTPLPRRRFLRAVATHVRHCSARSPELAARPLPIGAVT